MKHFFAALVLATILASCNTCTLNNTPEEATEEVIPMVEDTLTIDTAK